MTRLALLAAALLALAFAPLTPGDSDDAVKIGSKKFTESILLGDMVKLLAEDAGAEVTHYQELGGTKVVFRSLVDGEIDAYVEYTGTIAEEILTQSEDGSLESMRGELAKQGVVMGEPLGFNNTYVLAMRRERAAELGVEKISDLARLPDLRFGFGSEFMGRKEGWPAVRKTYNLPQQNVTGLDHDLAYRELDRGGIDLVDAYATDAEIAKYDLVLLEDDRGHFPRYDAVLLYRDDLRERAPKVVESIRRLEGTITQPEMAAMNARVVDDRTPAVVAAADYLASALDFAATPEVDRRTTRMLRRTGEHLNLVRKSLIPAILMAVPLGVLAAKRRRLGHGVLAVVGVIQTIPSLALLVGLMPLVAWLGGKAPWMHLSSIGPDSTTAIVALLLYSLLPIVRNTHAGITGIAPEHREAAESLGLPARFRLVNIELPLASPSILAGIKTAAVLNVGFATLGALIGAGGYGQPILSGIRLQDTGMILEGAIPSAALALLVQGAFELGERWLTPRGLRIKTGE